MTLSRCRWMMQLMKVSWKIFQTFGWSKSESSMSRTLKATTSSPKSRKVLTIKRWLNTTLIRSSLPKLPIVSLTNCWRPSVLPHNQTRRNGICVEALPVTAMTTTKIVLARQPSALVPCRLNWAMPISFWPATASITGASSWTWGYLATGWLGKSCSKGRWNLDFDDATCLV